MVASAVQQQTEAANARISQLKQQVQFLAGRVETEEIRRLAKRAKFSPFLAIDTPVLEQILVEYKREEKLLVTQMEGDGEPIVLTLNEDPLDVGDGLIGWVAAAAYGPEYEHCLTLWRWPQKVTFPLHRHAWAERVTVLEGAVQMALAGKMLTLQAGRSLTIEEYVPHRGQALKDTLMLVAHRVGSVHGV